MAKIIAFFALFASLYSELLEVDEIEKTLPLIDENTWVLFDIDPEPEMTNSLQKMNQAAGAVFGLTALGPPVDAAILKQLTAVGVRYAFNAQFRPNLDKKPPAEWDGGIVFISDFNRKIEIFQKWIEFAQFRPSKLVVIHSGQEILPLEEQMQKSQIPFHLIHLLKN